MKVVSDLSIWASQLQYHKLLLRLLCNPLDLFNVWGNGVCGESYGRVRTKRAVAKAGSKKKCVSIANNLFLLSVGEARGGVVAEARLDDGCIHRDNHQSSTVNTRDFSKSRN